MLNLPRLLLCMAVPSLALADSDWPDGVSEIQHPSTADGSHQPAMFHAAPEGNEPAPLLVGLHTWSGNYTQSANGAAYARWCIDQGWNFIYPNFRGINKTPEAMGSDLAVQDVVDAVAWAKQNAAVDENRIYLIGVSGGGHMALLMAGRHPEIWAGVSAWCGISDIAAWHDTHTPEGKPDRYGVMMESALQGSPKVSTQAAEQALHRSPLHWLHRAKSVNLDINHGIDDGRTGSVPFTHSLHAFNQVVGPEAGMPGTIVTQFYESLKPPADAPPVAPDPTYGAKEVLFRETSANTRITIFEGGHEMIYLAGLNWLSAQRKGQPAVWSIDSPITIELGDGESGK